MLINIICDKFINMVFNFTTYQVQFSYTQRRRTFLDDVNRRHIEQFHHRLMVLKRAEAFCYLSQAYVTDSLALARRPFSTIRSSGFL